MRLLKWFLGLWIKQNPKKQDKHFAPPSRLFHACEVVKLPPPNNEIPDGKFIVVIPSKEPKWALFRCPCGCGHVITLSLASGRIPQWRVRLEGGIYPTLYPSVRQLNGCYSHFLVRDGRIYWCDDTGIP
ncbi:MAG: DUF6527 family protein [Methylobacter sp.]|jgi:hypothetical protein